MDARLEDFGVVVGKTLRIQEECVSGKKVAVSHIISRPPDFAFDSFEIAPEESLETLALGIMNLMPSETVVICADVILKSSPVKIEVLDRFSGTLVFVGKLSAVKSAMESARSYVHRYLGFELCELSQE